MYTQKERIAFFIDLDSLNTARSDFFKLTIYRNDKVFTKKINEDLWRQFNARFLHLGTDVLQNEISNMSHLGTWMFVGRRYFIKTGEKTFLEFIKNFDSLDGFIVQYGHNIDVPILKNGKPSTKLEDRGVDTLLACQMLMGAMEDKYDSCLLFTEDQDFLPLIELIQNRYGKRVIHAGYNSETLLRPMSFGHIKLETLNQNFNAK